MDPVATAAPSPIVREVPASMAQRLVWLMARRADPAALNERLLWAIDGDLDAEALEQALSGLIERHEALRTTFAGRGRTLVQRVHGPRPVALSPGRPAGGAEAAIEAETAAPLAPEDGPLRARLWRLGEARHMLMLSVHQLVSDLASGALIARDLGRIYDHLVAGGPPLPPVAQQYADWSERQRAALEGGRLAELQEFWRRQLEGTRFAQLPMPAASGSGLGERGEERRDLGPDAAAALAATAHQLETTRFVLALSVFFALLGAHTGQRDLAVSTLFANRSAEVLDTVGLFANLVVLRARLASDERFESLVRAIAATVRDCECHQELPFGMLPPRTFSADRPGRPDDVLFQYIEGEPSAEAHLCLAGLAVAPQRRTWRRSRFGLELFVHRSEEAIAMVLLYDLGRFGPGWAAAFLEDYAARLERVLTDPGQPIR